MMLRSLPALLAAGLLASAQPAAAGPQAVVDALQAEPATLWDLSLARLAALVQADGLAGNYSAWVHAEPPDRVKVMAWSLSVPATEGNCKALLDRLRRLAGVDPETGLPDLPASAFANYFSYPRLDEFAIDPTYMESVDALFRLVAVIGIAGDGKAVICQGPLLSGGADYSWE